MEILGMIAGAVSIVCWIMVLIKMFNVSVLQGIFGIICGLWAFIWGSSVKNSTNPASSFCRATGAGSLNRMPNR